jgi:LuxR family transcriptional regulator, positive regulator of biofilm formation
VWLVDASIKDPRSFLIELEAYGTSNDASYHIAFINSTYSLGMEKRALAAGIIVFFYVNDRLDLLLRGMESVVRADVWMPRQLLLQCALGAAKDSEQTPDESPTIELTPRERQVLLLVYMGKTNEEIAKQLGITDSTVKTHLYKLYRKINVPNRV